MRRKLFCGITVFAMVFATCMAGYAQTTGTTDVDCPVCPKCDPWHIPAGTCATLSQGETASTTPFDYDATYGYCEQGGTLTPTANPAVRNCKAIFNICACEPYACDYEEGWVLGFQMEILTPGVYWTTDPNVTAFPLAGTIGYSPATYELKFNRYQLNTAALCSSATMMKTNNGVAPDNTYYDTLKVAYYTNTYQANLGNILAAGPGINGANLSKVIRTPTPYDGWEITDADAKQKLCEWWLDMPAMVASGAVTPGQHVQVEISLYVSRPLDEKVVDLTERLAYLRSAPAINNGPIIGDWNPGIPPFDVQGQYYEPTVNCYDSTLEEPKVIACDADQTPFVGTGAHLWQWDGIDQICSDCATPCRCIVDVGILCCEASEGDFCLTFPYVLQQSADEDGNGSPDWATGIALSQLCAPGTGITPEVTLTLTDCTGAKFTNSIADFGTCLGTTGMTVDQMVSEYGWTPAAGQAWLQVESNFPMGGYQFNMYSAYGNLFGAGVLPQGCWDCQTPGTPGTPAEFDWAD